MARCRVGVHARNDRLFGNADYEVLRIARIETLKMMSFNDNEVFRRAREINPDMEFIVRLWDDRIGVGTHPTPQEFVERHISRIRQLQPWVRKFEIHNEPNHADGYEGWGPTDDDARDFRDWYLEVLRRFRQLAPWAEFGFPGLAVYDTPHRDRAWLEVCRPAVKASDWLGVHCYWQYKNMRHPEWGLRFRLIHDMFPNMPIEITEFGNSTPGLKVEVMAQEYREYYTLLREYPYVRSASAFILSSPSPEWAPFVWRKESGEIMPVAYEVANVPREEVPRPLPAEQWRVEWVQVNVPPQVSIGAESTCSFVIRNAGNTTWTNQGPNRVRLGYHWYDSNGQGVLADRDVRTELPRPVAPGETVEIPVAVVVPPPLPGRFILRWDLVEEGRAWFTSRGSPPADVTVEVVLGPEARRTFPETGKTVEQPFLGFFYRYGLEITGYPLTDVIVEDGMRSQYWQRVAMEEPAPGQVRLKLIGQELLELRQKVVDLQRRLQLGGVRPPLTPPRIVDVIAQLPRDPERMVRRSLDGIRYVVFDHTAIPRQVSLQRIAEAHTQRLPGIAYQYYIDMDGTVYQTQPLEEVVSDREDYISGVRVGVAGDFSEDVPNEQQLATAAHLTAWLLQRFGLSLDAVKGTSEFVVTQSPGRQWLEGKRWKDLLLARVQEWLERTAPPGAGVDTGELISILDQVRQELTDHQRVRDSLLRQLRSSQELNQTLQAELERAHEEVGQLQAALDRLQSLIRRQEIPTDGARAAERVPMPPMENVVDKLPRHPDKQYPTRPLEQVTHIAIHHSAAPANISLERIARYHVEDHGWPGIGYHFYIAPDGTIYKTNEITTLSNQVYANNHYTLGICVAGNFSDVVPTPAQLDAAARLVAWLTQELNIPLENVKGHKEYPENTTQCPGVQWLEGQKWKEMLLARIEEVRAGEVPRPAQKPLYHYVLFWQTPEDWARSDWLNSLNYVARYRPTMGFSHDDAMHAQKVTIVGGPLGVSAEIEQMLKDAGCQVRRLAGANEAETKAMLDRLAEEGDPFLTT